MKVFASKILQPNEGDNMWILKFKVFYNKCCMENKFFLKLNYLTRIIRKQDEIFLINEKKCYWMFLSLSSEILNLIENLTLENKVFLPSSIENTHTVCTYYIQYTHTVYSTVYTHCK